MARLKYLVVLPGIGGSVLAESGSPGARGAGSAEGIVYGLTPGGPASAVLSPSSLAGDRDMATVEVAAHGAVTAGDTLVVLDVTEDGWSAVDADEYGGGW